MYRLNIWFWLIFALWNAIGLSANKMTFPDGCCLAHVGFEKYLSSSSKGEQFFQKLLLRQLFLKRIFIIRLKVVLDFFSHSFVRLNLCLFKDSVMMTVLLSH